MSAKLSKSILSKVLALGAVVGACVGGAAMPASAATITADGPPWHWDDSVGGSVYARGEGIDLGSGKVVEKSPFSGVVFTEDAAHNPTELWLKSRVNTEARVGYQIKQQGEATPYWLAIDFNLRVGVEGYAECGIYEGEPGRPGVNEPTWESPFECEAHRLKLWQNKFEFMVGLVGLAEASGSISPTGVALKDGTFSTESTFNVPGASQVAAGGSTRFGAVLREGDTPFYENQARTEWAYQIIDNNVETGMWVAGLATNHRGIVKFSGDGRCGIYETNPLAGAGRLDEADPIHPEDAAYTCTATGEMLHGPGEYDNRHFDGTYTVSKKEPKHSL